jgi:hypothetical protein
LDEVTRRRFLNTTALIAGAAPLASCSSAERAYREAVAQTWGPFDGSTERSAVQRELVRYATLAPSSHNTQCWIFRLENNQISIGPDSARRCPAVDPDDHHLFVSLGCAAENLVLAGLAHGLRGNARFDPTGEGAVRVHFEPAVGNSSISEAKRSATSATDAAERKVRILEVRAGGFLGLGDKHFLLSVDAVTSVGEDAVHVNETRERIVHSPAYDPHLVDGADARVLGAVLRILRSVAVLGQRLFVSRLSPVARTAARCERAFESRSRPVNVVR